jgi:hypothetical protein
MLAMQRYSVIDAMALLMSGGQLLGDQESQRIVQQLAVQDSLAFAILTLLRPFQGCSFQNRRQEG